MSSSMGVEGALHYFSFLLRLWQVPTDRENALRILLENVLTGEKRGFTSLEELLAYLNQVTAETHETSAEGSHIEVQGGGDNLAPLDSTSRC